MEDWRVMIGVNAGGKLCASIVNIWAVLIVRTVLCCIRHWCQTAGKMMCCPFPSLVDFPCLASVFWFPFLVLILLICCHDEHTACKKLLQLSAYDFLLGTHSPAWNESSEEVRLNKDLFYVHCVLYRVPQLFAQYCEPTDMTVLTGDCWLSLFFNFLLFLN